jgi:alkylmercury lyase-like protein
MNGRHATQRSAPEDRSGLTESARIVRRAAFRGILETGRPWDATDARDLPLDVAFVRAAVGELVDAGRAYVDPTGRVTAAAGLSTDPTAHRLQLAAGSRWTNCAYDALGILGALRADGMIESRSPATGKAISVRFERGRPLDRTPVLFLADESCSVRPNEDWCPNVNLFEDGAAASRWAREHGVDGRVLSLDEGTELGTAEWRSLVDGLEGLGTSTAGSWRKHSERTE